MIGLGCGIQWPSAHVCSISAAHLFQISFLHRALATSLVCTYSPSMLSSDWATQEIISLSSFPEAFQNRALYRCGDHRYLSFSEPLKHIHQINCRTLHRLCLLTKKSRNWRSRASFSVIIILNRADVSNERRSTQNLSQTPTYKLRPRNMFGCKTRRYFNVCCVNPPFVWSKFKVVVSGICNSGRIFRALFGRIWITLWSSKWYLR